MLFFPSSGIPKTDIRSVLSNLPSSSPNTAGCRQELLSYLIQQFSLIRVGMDVKMSTWEKRNTVETPAQLNPSSHPVLYVPSILLLPPQGLLLAVPAILVPSRQLTKKP